jgi:RND family efflux transporter MFP subunit
MSFMRAFMSTWVVVLLVASGCRRTDSSTVIPESAPVTVKTAMVASESLPVVIELPAIVRPAERAVISAKITGTIAALPWGLGQEVKAGDVLVTIAAPETEARVRQAQARLAEAERATDRERTLVTKGVNPPDALRDAEDRLRFAQAGLAEAEALLAHASIRAPFAGVITEKPVLPGDLATPGLPLLTLESTARLRAEGTVPEQAAVGLRLGSRLDVALTDTAPAVEGTVEELSAAADAVSRSVLVRVALPAGFARSGQFARLQVATGHAAALLVPIAAITHFGQMERVFVVSDGRAALRLVKTGRESGARIEVLSGLQAGETVLINPPASLREGARVIVAP